MILVAYKKSVMKECFLNSNKRLSALVVENSIFHYNFLFEVKLVILKQIDALTKIKHNINQ